MLNNGDRAGAGEEAEGAEGTRGWRGGAGPPGRHPPALAALGSWARVTCNGLLSAYVLLGGTCNGLAHLAAIHQLWQLLEAGRGKLVDFCQHMHTLLGGTCNGLAHVAGFHQQLQLLEAGRAQCRKGGPFVELYQHVLS